MMFRDRRDAGRKLAERLKHLRGDKVCVLALPRGGVPVAAEIATALGAPLDILHVRKIGVPSNPEVAMGAIVDGHAPVVVRNEGVIAMAGITDADFDRACLHQLAELDRRHKIFDAMRPKLDPKGKTAIVVDDGIATGATVKAAIKGLAQRGPDRIVLAVPVAPSESMADIAAGVDEVICLGDLQYGAVGASYLDFSQTTDDEVLEILADINRPRQDAP